MTRPAGLSAIPHIMAAIDATLWAIKPEKYFAIMEFLELRARGQAFSAEELEARGIDLNAAGGRSSNRVIGAVAVVPVMGTIMHRMETDMRVSGGTTVTQLARAFDEAMANPDVGAIVLDIDSPGGTVEGIAELATRIFKARGQGKQIIAIANAHAHSAAYWLATAADQVVITPSGQVGDIGVFGIHTDQSEADAKAGIKRTLIKYGKYKAETAPFTPLGEEAKAALQAQVDEMGGMFTAAVAKYRGVTSSAVKSGFGEGRSVLAKQAVELGMADRVATFDQVITDLTGRKAGAVAPARAEGGSVDLAAEHLDGLDQSGRTRARVEVLLAAAAAPSPTLTLIQPARGALGDLTDSPAALTGPKGQEHVMPPETAAADQGAALDAARREASTAATKRSTDVLALCESHEVPLKTANELVASGKSVDAVAREILEFKRATTRPATITLGPDRAEGKPWETMGHFFGAVMNYYSPGGEQDVRLAAAASGMNQAVPSEGGMLVPPQFSTKIWDEMNASPDNLLQMTDSYPIDGESITFNANAETSRATGSRYGGIKGYWINEADQITKSKPKFRQLRLEPKELAVLVYVTDKNLRNSTAALQTYLQRASGDEINFLVGDAIVRGAGVGQPQGLLASGSTITVNKETSQAAGTFQQENITKMWARLHPRAQSQSVWLMNIDVSPTLDQLNSVVKNVAGTENVGGYANKVYDSEKQTLKGRPIKFVEYCESLGTLGDVILWAPGWYATGVRSGGILEAMSIHVRFEFAETAFRFMFAVDGQPWLASALTPYKGANTLSSQVILQAR